MSILSDELDDLKRLQVLNSKKYKDFLEDYKKWLPLKKIGFGLFAFLSISFIIHTFLKDDTANNKIWIVSYIVLNNFLNYMLFFNKTDPKIETERQELETLEINLKRLEEILSNKRRIMLFLRPYRTKQIVENRTNLKKGLQRSRYTRSQRRKFLSKIKKTMERKVADGLMYKYQAWELNNNEVTYIYGVWPIHAVQEWECTFYKVAKYADYFIILIEDKISHGLNSELSYIMENNLEEYTLVILFNTTHKLPFEPRWKINLSGPTPYKISFPDDFLREIEYLKCV